MRQDSSGWSCRTMEDGPTLCSFQGSVYNATVSKIVPPSPSTRAALPVLPVSPIKNTSAMAASRRRSTRGESLAQHVDEHRPSAERSTMRKTPPKQQYEYFRRQLQFANDTMTTSDEEDVKGKDTYEQIVRLREMLLMKKQSRKNNNVSCNGTYLPPSRTFYPFDSEHTIEKARHRSETPPTPARRQDTIKELLDINLKTYKEIGVGNDTIGRIEIPRLVGSSSGPSMPTELRRSFSTKTLHSLSSDPRQSSSSVLVKDSDASTRQGRPEVRKLVRGIFNDVYDVDKLPQKGAKKAHQRHLSSSNFQSAMGLDSRAKSQQPRVPVRVNTRSRTQNSASPAKPPPFCSSVNNNDYSQAIRANEQELIKLVNTYFPQWRAFVQNLLTDRNVEHDVAMRFYEEIESRRKAKELDMAVQRSEDQQIYEFNHQDEKIASRLREQLCRGHPSRMRQLRILYQVLKDSC